MSSPILMWAEYIRRACLLVLALMSGAHAQITRLIDSVATVGNGPQGLKPTSLSGLSGTAEAVPFPGSTNQTSSSHIEAAAQRLSSGDTEGAEAEARKGLQDPSTKALALAMLGTIRLQQGKADDSIKFLTQALALNSKLVGARTTLGNAYAFAGKMHLAAKCFREVLNADPKISTPASICSK